MGKNVPVSIPNLTEGPKTPIDGATVSVLPRLEMSSKLLSVKNRSLLSKSRLTVGLGGSQKIDDILGMWFRESLLLS
jgi:hypothetical protein